MLKKYCAMSYFILCYSSVIVLLPAILVFAGIASLVGKGYSLIVSLEQQLLESRDPGEVFLDTRGVIMVEDG